MPRKQGYVPPPNVADSSVIDHRYYPHIVDEIFSHAEIAGIASLLPLRSASKAWRERVDRKIAYHLVLKGNMVPIEVHSGLLQCRLVTVTAENLDDAKDLHPSWARFVRVIDVDATSKHKDLCELLTAWNVDHYETLRFTSGPPMFSRHSMLCEQPLRIVYLQARFLSPGGLLQDVRMKNRRFMSRSSYFMGYAWWTTVLHYTCATPALGRSFDMDHIATLAGNSMMLYIHPWETPPVAVENGNMGRALADNFGSVWQLVSTGVISGILRLTVVGLENLSTSATGPDVFGGKNLGQAFVQSLFDIKQLLGFHAIPDDDGGVYSDEDDDPEEDERKKPSINCAVKTEDEYRAERDKAEHEIETSPVITRIQHDWLHSHANAQSK